MYARVLFAQFRPEQTDEIIQLYRQAVVPEQSKQHGAKGTMVLIDRARGKGISMTFWETEEAAEEGLRGTRSFYAEQIEKFVTLYRSPPGREMYDVVVADAPAVALG